MTDSRPDPFNTSRNSDPHVYSPNDFFTRSVDDKGHKAECRVHVPPTLMAEIHNLIAERRFPHYRTPADVFRDAAYHRLRWLAEEYDDDQLRDLVEKQRLFDELEQERQRYAEDQAAADNVVATVMMTRNPERKAALVEMGRKLVPTLPNDLAEELERFLDRS